MSFLCESHRKFTVIAYNRTLVSKEIIENIDFSLNSVTNLSWCSSGGMQGIFLFFRKIFNIDQYNFWLVLGSIWMVESYFFLFQTTSIKFYFNFGNHFWIKSIMWCIIEVTFYLIYYRGDVGKLEPLTIVNGFETLTIVAELSIVYVCGVHGYVSVVGGLGLFFLTTQ